MKAHKLLYLLLILLFFLPVSCKKKKEDDLFRKKTIANGRVLDYYTGLPAEGVKIVLVEKEPVLYGHPYDYILTRKDSVYTDPVGFFTFNFRAKIGEKYTYYVFHPTEGDYFNGGEKNISKNTENSLNFSLKGKTRLNIHIKNVSPFNQDDVLYWGTELLIGMNIDTIIAMNTNGYGSIWPLSWQVVKNNIQTNFSDTVAITYKKQHYYEILY